MKIRSKNKLIVPEAFREINGYARGAKRWLQSLRDATDPLQYAAAILNVDQFVDDIIERCDLAMRGDFSKYYEQEYVKGVRVE